MTHKRHPMGGSLVTTFVPSDQLAGVNPSSPFPSFGSGQTRRFPRILALSKKDQERRSPRTASFPCFPWQQGFNAVEKE